MEILVERRSTMKTNRKVRMQLILMLFAVLTSTASVCAAGDFLYVSTTDTLSYSTYVGQTPIPGLSLTLPAAGKYFNTAVVTLNMPNLFLSEPTSQTIPMAATISITAPSAPGGILVVNGGIGCDSTDVLRSGLKPITIVAKVPLSATSQQVEAEWADVGSTVTTQTYASLSAILVKE
jgi:hypothetical protein